MLGVKEITIARDLGKNRGATNVAKESRKTTISGGLEEEKTTDVVSPPPMIAQSGSQAAKAAEKAAKIVAVGMAEEAKRLAQDDAHDAGTIVIYAEVKLGELLAANPPGFNRKNSGEIQQNLLPMSRILDIETGDTHNRC
ncbi:MAG: hypothetical protein ABSH06_10100 [Thermodesulfobacteriota bacterium]|jgi:hypothetical protein